MKSKFIGRILAVIAFAAIFTLSGCEFGTYVKTDKIPEQSVTGFFDSLRSKDLEGCGKYLADNDSFEITNSTGFDFADMALDAQLTSLDYELVGSAEVSGAEASCRVNITGLDIADIEAAMVQEYPKVRSQYMIDNALEDFSTDDKEALNAVVSNTFNKVISEIQPTQKEVSVKLKFQDNSWKIVLNDELCAAVFGGDV